MPRRSPLERALEAEERADELEARVGDLLGRLKGVLGSDPTSAVRALSWMSRAENGEKLIQEIVSSDMRSTDLPPGWLTRAEAQLAALRILKRDQRELTESAPDDEWWEQYANGYATVRPGRPKGDR
jgi:hypothetical protein